MALILTVPGGTPNQLAVLQAVGQDPCRAQLIESSLLPGVGVGLSNVRWVDGATTVPVAEQTGAINAPFSTVQRAVNSLGATAGTVFICPGVYAEAVTVPVAIHLVGLTAGRVNPTVSITSISTSGPNTSLNRLAVGSLTTTVSGTTIQDCNISGAVSLFGAFNGFNSAIGALTCTAILGASNVAFNGAITLTQTTGASQINAGCTFALAADITGPGATSQILWDSDSYWRFINGAANTVTAINSELVRVRLASATVAINVPALAAGQTGEAAVSLAGTQLSTFSTARAVQVTPPVAALAPGVGIGNGGLLSGRITSTGNLTCTFLGALTGGATPGFIVVGLT